MTAQPIFRKRRTPRATRLLGWALMAAVCGFLMWIVFGGAAHAEDPRAAARAIGNTGTAAARAIARDSSQASTVPGYAGTNLPERSIGANALEDEGRARLADPDDPGGAAGRAVVEGVTRRPAADVPASDAMVRRSETITESPQSSIHGADGLASGSATGCGADLDDAGDGGSCGSVRYCVGAGCETVSPQSNTGFANATTRLNMAVELGGEEFDRDNLEFFKGTRQRCHIHFGGLADCCKNSGLLVGLVNLTTLPVYRVANAAAAYRGAVIDQEMDALAEAVALDVMQVWITDLHRTVEERAGTLDIADGEQLQRWREGLRSNRVALARHRHQGLQRLNTALAVVEKLRLIETELAGALSADLRAALAFARGGAGAGSR